MNKNEIDNAIPQEFLMPRIVWMLPGQSFFVGGLIRIDLLEVLYFILICNIYFYLKKK